MKFLKITGTRKSGGKSAYMLEDAIITIPIDQIEIIIESQDGTTHIKLKSGPMEHVGNVKTKKVVGADEI